MDEQTTPPAVVIFERLLPPELCELARSFHQPRTKAVEHQVGGAPWHLSPEPTATWLDHDNPDHVLLFETMAAVAAQAAPVLGVADLGQSATVKILEYAVGERLGPHADTAPGNEVDRRAEVLGRTLSLMAQLHDGDEYTGGDLVLTTAAGERLTMPRSAGTCVVYRSDTVHEVTPVESGVRLCTAGFFSTEPAGA